MPQAVFMQRLLHNQVAKDAVDQLLAHYAGKAGITIHFTETDTATLLIRVANPGASGRSSRNLFSMTWRPRHDAFRCRLYALQPGFVDGTGGVRGMRVVNDPLKHECLFDPAQGGALQRKDNTDHLLKLIDHAIGSWK